jgi:DNA-3-methyladenine glycosylase
MERLSVAFFTRGTLTVARELIGKILEHKVEGGSIMGIISEAEAYTEDDPGSNTYRGRRTEANRAMYMDGGHLFIYKSYGVHRLINITADTQGKGCGVLLRRLLPHSGSHLLLGYGTRPIEKLLDGPGKLTKALQIPMEYYGLNLLSLDSRLQVHDLGLVPRDLQSTTRVGLSAGSELKWRFIGKEFE